MVERRWSGRVRDAGAAARRGLERWLAWALAGRDGAGRLPRIPTRLVSAGGYDDLTATPQGRALAAAWWEEHLALVPDRPWSRGGNRPRHHD